MHTPSCSRFQSKQAYEKLDIPKQYHPFINGPNGDMQKKLIGDLANVRINIPPLSGTKTEMSVAGEKEAVMQVVEKIKALHMDMVSSLRIIHTTLVSSVILRDDQNCHNFRSTDS